MAPRSLVRSGSFSARRGSVQAARVGVIATGLLASLLAHGCSRPAPEPPAEEILASPYPPQYEWALMTVEGPMVGEVSVEEPHFGYENIDGRIAPAGVFIGFGSAARRVDLRLEPYAGTGRYVIKSGSGSFTLTLEGESWSTDVSGICSFVFTKVSAVQYAMKPAPPLEVESYEADIGFVCPALGSLSGKEDLTIIHGKMHAFFFRLPADSTGSITPYISHR